MKGLIQGAVRKLGYEVRRVHAEGTAFPPDFDDFTREVIGEVRPFSMTSNESLAALIDACRYLVRHRVAGSIVECGVWRGGSMMAAARTFQRLGAADRPLHLFDTFEGMPAPGEKDRSNTGDLARDEFERRRLSADSSNWCYSSFEEVRGNVARTGYPDALVSLVKGKVEDTLPAGYPGGPIALLRLDTDWYESTRHELTHLYPLLVPGGVLIIDDYGHWEGARVACDEYFAQLKAPLLLHRIDYTARLAVKFPG